MLYELTKFAMNYDYLRNLIRYGNVLRYNKGVEVGVYKGDTSFHLLREFPELTLYSVDPYEYYSDEFTLVQLKEAEEYARQRLSTFRERSNIVKAKSVDAAKCFEKESLDFIFIDGDHGYQSVKNDITAWFSKIRGGGLFSGHDYRWDGVGKAVNELSELLGINGFFSPLSSDVWFFEADLSLNRAECQEKLDKWATGS